MEFFDSLTDALAANNGQLSLQQAVDLLADSQKHRVMTHLNAARNSGVCAYNVRRTNGKGVITVTSPPKATSTRSPLVGGTS